MALLITTIAIILIFTGLIIWRTVSSIRNRKTPIPEGFKVIQLQGITISWGGSLLTLIFLLPLVFSDINFSKDPWSLIPIVIFLEFLLDFGINVYLQKFFQPDRIIYGNKEIIYLGEWKRTVKLDSISKISLNGLNDKISIHGKILL